MNYYISDLHLGHYNIIKLCHRPFISLEEMNETIIKNWNEIITPNDTVYIVGDFAYKDAGLGLRLCQRLNGHKILIEGNHDWKNLQDPNFRNCFDEIHQQLTITDNNKMIFLSHYPTVEWDGYYRNSLHIFGHIHNNVTNSTYHNICLIDPEVRMLNCGCDITNFKPVTLDELIKINKDFRKRFKG